MTEENTNQEKNHDSKKEMKHHDKKHEKKNHEVKHDNKSSEAHSTDKAAKNDTFTISKVALWQIISAVLVIALVASLYSGGFGATGGSNEGTKVTPNQGPGVSSGLKDADIVDNAPFLGDANAPVTIIEFSDYSCPFCARHYLQTKPSIISDYVDKGLVKYVWVDFVGVGTPAPHEATLCVREIGGDEAFWVMNGLILNNQQDVRSNPSKLSDLAVQAGVDLTKFNECLNSKKYVSQIQASTQLGQSLGIRGTPGFLIGSEGDYEVVSGAQPYSAFKTAIDAALAK